MAEFTDDFDYADLDAFYTIWTNLSTIGDQTLDPSPSYSVDWADGEDEGSRVDTIILPGDINYVKAFGVSNAGGYGGGTTSANVGTSVQLRSSVDLSGIDAFLNNAGLVIGTDHSSLFGYIVYNDLGEPAYNDVQFLSETETRTGDIAIFWDEDEGSWFVEFSVGDYMLLDTLVTLPPATKHFHQVSIRNDMGAVDPVELGSSSVNSMYFVYEPHEDERPYYIPGITGSFRRSSTQFKPR